MSASKSTGKITATQRRNARRRRALKAAQEPQNLTGYRLHDARIDYSGGVKSMRTVKVELLNLDHTRQERGRGQGLQAVVAKTVFDDYRWLYGPANFEDFLTDPHSPSFLGLWILAMRHGVIMSNKALTEFGEMRTGSPTGRIFDSIPAETRSLLDKAKWLAWYDKGVKSTSTEQSRLKSFDKVFAGGKATPQLKALWETAELNCALTGDVAALGRPAFKQELFGIPQAPEQAAEQAEAGTPAAKSSQQTERKGTFWAIDPGFAQVTEDNITKALDQVIDQWTAHLGGNVDAAKRFMGIGDNGSHLNNGLLGDFFTQVHSTPAPELAQQLSRHFAYTEDEKRVVIERLEKLAEYARRLPARPALVPSWKEYRIDMSAKMESWLTNRSGKGRTAVEDIWGVEGDSKNTGLLGLLTDMNNAAELDSGIAQSIAALIEDIGPRRTAVDRALTSMIGESLSSLRGELNAWRQRQAGLWVKDAAGAGKSKKANPWDLGPKAKGQHPIVAMIGKLPRKVQSSPLFWGQGKQELWKQLLHLKQYIATGAVDGHGDGGLQALQNVHQQVLAQLPPNALVGGVNRPPAKGNKDVEQLARLWARLQEATDANPAVVDRLAKIEKKLDVKFAHRQRNAQFYLSGRQGGSVKLLDEPQPTTLKDLLDLADLPWLYAQALKTPDKESLLRDTIQLSKVVLSAALYAVTLGQAEDRQEQIGLTLLHSQLQGCAFLLQKKTFISRATLQGVNGSQCVLATQNADTPQRFYYVFPHLSASSLDQQAGAAARAAAIPLRMAGQGNLGSFQDFKDSKVEVTAGQEGLRKPRGGTAHTLSVATSRYHTQFYTWWAGQHSSKASTLEVAGSFVVAEREVTLDWSGPQPQIKHIEAPRLFVSQPFTIVPADKVRSGPGKPSLRGRRFVGVDVGEKGLAWAVWEYGPSYWDGTRIDLDAASCLASGFVQATGHDLLRDAVHHRRETHAVRTFTSPDTYVARLRKDVVASYQAKLEAIAIAYDAQLVFEKNIPNFEVQAKSLTVIDHVIKRSAVFGRTDAEKADNKQHWGDVRTKNLQATHPGQKVPYGVEVSDWMTSQTCTACGRTYANAYPSVSGQPGSISHAGTVRYFDTAGSTPTISVRDIDTDTQWDTDQDRRDFERAVKQAMRPALRMKQDNTFTAGAQILVEHLTVMGTTEDSRGMAPLKATSLHELDTFEKDRGRSAIFICPYTDCLYIADADVQAAHNIALRGWITATSRRENPNWYTGSLATSDKGTQLKLALQNQLLAAWTTAMHQAFTEQPHAH